MEGRGKGGGERLRRGREGGGERWRKVEVEEGEGRKREEVEGRGGGERRENSQTCTSRLQLDQFNYVRRLYPQSVDTTYSTWS